MARAEKMFAINSMISKRVPNAVVAEFAVKNRNSGRDDAMCFESLVNNYVSER